MRATKCHTEQLHSALGRVNKQYEGNVSFNRFDPLPRGGADFTLRVNNSHKPGHRFGFTGRHLVAACWHVHRDFLTHLFKLAPGAVVRTCRAKYRGRDGFEANFSNTGNANIGSVMQPMFYREACECERTY